MFTSLLGPMAQKLRVPSACGVCQSWGTTPICAQCVAQFVQLRLRCVTCALPMTHADQTRCGGCLTLGSALDACQAAVDYAYPWDALLQRFKYSDGGDLRAQPALAETMAWITRSVAQRNQALARGLEDAQRSDWIVPVALHPHRQRERGFNQAAAFAQALFPRHPKLRHDLLLRVKDTETQTNLPRDARAHNMRGAFIAEPTHAARLQGARVTLIDDVTTTTATLGAAAHALRQAGVGEITAIVFARAA
jgi:ComF family protein